MLENLSDKELFQLRDDLEERLTYLYLHTVYQEAYEKMEKLEEVDNEITRRDDVNPKD